jgi:hypothetical protein
LLVPAHPAHLGPVWQEDSMTLFPWPEHFNASFARQGVLWKRSNSSPRGLLIDSPAIPLQFTRELQSDDPTPVAPAVAVTDVAQRDEALQRVRQVEQLLAVRELMQR